MVAVLSLAVTFLLSAVAVNAQLPADLPKSCNACVSLANMLASGNSQACALDTTCVCSDNVASGLKSCYQCSVDSKVIDQKTADNELADYENACKQAGHPVSSASSLTMSGFAAAAALGGLILL